jgi:arylsulfatase A-like enzyme
MDWVERNRARDGFLLWVDMWDPHEPFDAPAFDLARYADPAFEGEQIIYPRYGRGDYMTEAERNHVRALYAGLVTCTDRWVGRFLEKLETVGLADNTLVVFLTDHGHLFGDHDLQGKPTGPFGRLYEPTARVPLMVRHPSGVGAGRRIGGLAQHPDLLPTILEFLDVTPPSGIHGRSLWPLIDGRAERVRDTAFSGRFSRHAGTPTGPDPEAAMFDGWAGGGQLGEPVTVTTEEWALVCPVGVGDRELYHLPSDPAQLRDVIADHPDVARDLHGRLTRFLADAGAPDERIRLYGEPQPRLALRRGARLHAIQDEHGLWLAYPNQAEARSYLTPALRTPDLVALPFEDLLDRQPRALVSMQGQYYRAEDIAPA